jgi:hypothetical protein
VSSAIRLSLSAWFFKGRFNSSIRKSLFIRISFGIDWFIATSGNKFGCTIPGFTNSSNDNARFSPPILKLSFFVKDGDWDALGVCVVVELLLSVFVSVFVDTVGELLVVDAGAVSVTVALPVTSMDALATGTPVVTLGVLTAGAVVV